MGAEGEGGDGAGELLGKRATVLNAVAAAKLPVDLAMQRLDALLASGEISLAAHSTVTMELMGA